MCLSQTHFCDFIWGKWSVECLSGISQPPRDCKQTYQNMIVGLSLNVTELKAKNK